MRYAELKKQTCRGWNTWFFENRTLPGGAMCWGSGIKRGDNVAEVGNLQFAKYESGLDNSPMYDDAVFDEKTGLMMVEDAGEKGTGKSIFLFSELQGFFL